MTIVDRGRIRGWGWRNTRKRVWLSEVRGERTRRDAIETRNDTPFFDAGQVGAADKDGSPSPLTG
jgi:hypothetical protein